MSAIVHTPSGMVGWSDTRKHPDAPCAAHRHSRRHPGGVNRNRASREDVPRQAWLVVARDVR